MTVTHLRNRVRRYNPLHDVRQAQSASAMHRGEDDNEERSQTGAFHPGLSVPLTDLKLYRLTHGPREFLVALNVARYLLLS